jgi:hypothetical protein
MSGVSDTAPMPVQNRYTAASVCTRVSTLWMRKGEAGVVALPLPCGLQQSPYFVQSPLRILPWKSFLEGTRHQSRQAACGRPCLQGRQDSLQGYRCRRPGSCGIPFQSRFGLYHSAVLFQVGFLSTWNWTSSALSNLASSLSSAVPSRATDLRTTPTVIRRTAPSYQTCILSLSTRAIPACATCAASMAAPFT